MNGYKSAATKRQAETQADRPALVRTMLILSQSAEACGMPDLARFYQVQAVIIARATYRDLSANT